MNLIETKKLVDELIGRRQSVNKLKDTYVVDIESAEKKVDELTEALSIIQSVAQVVQTKVHNQLGGVVTRCLEAVFDDPYEFKLLFEQKRGRTEARLAFVRDGVQVDPLTASGGGVVDVAGFALRLACLMLTRPRMRPLVVLDEPFRFVSVEYRQRIRELLEGLADDLGIQFIMVTHMEDLKIGEVISL